MSLSDDELAEVRRVLEQQRERMGGRVAALAAKPELGAAQGFGKRIGDGTIEAVSRLTEIGVGASLEATLERTDRALAKLDEGTYGTCDVCGQAIPAKRLQARPESTLCVADAASAPSGLPRRRR